MKFIRKASPTRSGMPSPVYSDPLRRSKFYLLECKHKTIYVEGMDLIIQAFGKSHVKVLCDECKVFRQVKRKLSQLQYHGIKPPKSTQQPLF